MTTRSWARLWQTRWLLVSAQAWLNWTHWGLGIDVDRQMHSGPDYCGAEMHLGPLHGHVEWSRDPVVLPDEEGTT